MHSQQTFGAVFHHYVLRDHRGVLALCSLVFVLLIGFATHVWYPPFPYRIGMVPPRNIDCLVPFSCESLEGLLKAQARARTTVQHVYTHNPQPLVNLRRSLISLLAAVSRAESFSKLDENGRIAWGDLYPPNPLDTESLSQLRFEVIKQALEEDGKTEKAAECLAQAFSSMEQFGFLHELDFGPHEGSQDRIRIYSDTHTPDQAIPVAVRDVLYDKSKFTAAIAEAFLEFANQKLDFSNQEVEFANQELFVGALTTWLAPRLVPTLQKDMRTTQFATQKILRDVPPVILQYVTGQTIADAEKPLDESTLRILRAEYDEVIQQLTWRERFSRLAAFVTFFTILIMLGWLFLLRWERRRPQTLRAIFMLHLAMMITALSMIFIINGSTLLRHLEMLPLLLLAQWLAIMYSWGFALVLTLMITFITVHTTLINPHMVIIAGSAVFVICIQLDRLRSRGKLISVSFVGGFVASLLTITLGLMNDELLDRDLVQQAFQYFVWVTASGFVMTGLLPFIEKPLGLLTDMSLLELGDVSHPLLQELIRRAPATYSHSMQVGAIAETAVEAIGARGLLTRVGACFHDIGKIFKPEYFIENQVSRENIHDSLEPRISALVIVAHVKDGADLARQHHLPSVLVDLIEQHHGTSLVSYFYGVANRHNREHGSVNPLEEGSFRYPGPKPQTKESAVLMLADAAESACRSLDAGSPHRIENMVRQITKGKLEDGQFDECGLTLHELRIVEKSLITSLLALKHGRIKYPGQEKIEAAMDQKDMKEKENS